MSIYRFNITEDGTRTDGQDDLDLPDIDAAKDEAIHAARDILADRIRAGRLIESAWCEITDAAGAVQAIVYFKDAFARS